MRNGVTEEELVAKATGERVTLAAIEAAIIGEHYFTAAEGVVGAAYKDSRVPNHYPTSLGLLTICTLTLWNGWTILGKSACADPTNFNEDLGRRLAKTDAVNQIWPLMGYELKSRMARDNRMVRGALIEARTGWGTYIGTKVINAYPMDRASYNAMRGWTLPENENGADEGYIVEYTDRIEKPHVVEGFAGYISWSPKEVFERAYRPVRQVSAQPTAASAEGAGEASV